MVEHVAQEVTERFLVEIELHHVTLADWTIAM